MAPGDAGWLAFTSLTRKAFYILYHTVFPAGEPLHRAGRGRPRSMKEVDYLAMTLYWLRSRSTLTEVAVIFQCPISTVQRHLWRILHLLSVRLPDMELAEVRWPSPAQVALYGAQVLQKYPKFPRRRVPFAFMDGCNLMVQSPTDLVRQNELYNKVEKGVKVSNLFVWAPDGCLIYATFNHPGVTPDSLMASKIYRVLDEHTPPDFSILADSAFGMPDHSDPLRLIITLSPAKLAEASPAAKELGKFACSARVAAEWGNRALQGAYKRLTLPLSVSPHRRRIVLTCCIHLHNLRTRVTGIGQIAKAFDPEWCAQSNWRSTTIGPSHMQRYVDASLARQQSRAVQRGSRSGRGRHPET
jgi:hypothetical protein